MGSYTQLLYHIVFATKYRRPTIRKDVRESLYCYLGGIIRANKGHLMEIGGVADHVHLLAGLSASLAVSAVIRDLKAISSKWMNERRRGGDRFQWQIGYAAFSVSFSKIDVVTQYIRTQEEHHKALTFRDEYISMLKRHGIAFRLDHLFEDEYQG